jgi:hypothetical protein
VQSNNKLLPPTDYWFVLLALAHLFSFFSANYFLLKFANCEISFQAICGLICILLSLFLIVSRKKILSIPLALFFVALQIENMPENPNHQLFLSFIDFGLIIDFYLRPRSHAFPSFNYFNFVKAITIILYFFAGFAKLNTTYLTSNSCVEVFFGNIDNTLKEFIGLKPFYYLLTYLGTFWVALGSLILEFSIALLLCFRKTAKLGFFLAFVFHTLLVFDLTKRFYNFSAVMLLALATFILPNITETSNKLRFAYKIAIYSPLKTVLLTLFTLVSLFVLRSYKQIEFIVYPLFALTWFICFLPYFSYILREGQLKENSNLLSFNLSFGWFLPIIIIVFINGLGPYLGFKTRSSFSMYSNLSINGQSSNHYVVPRSLDLFSVMDDVVVLTNTDDKEVSNAYGRNKIYYYELYRIADKNSAFRYCYKRVRGNTYNAEECLAKDDGLPSAPPFYSLHKFFFFDRVYPKKECNW